MSYEPSPEMLIQWAKRADAIAANSRPDNRHRFQFRDKAFTYREMARDKLADK